jgi:hypothetical protein
MRSLVARSYTERANKKFTHSNQRCEAAVCTDMRHIVPSSSALATQIARAKSQRPVYTTDRTPSQIRHFWSNGRCLCRN